MAQIGSILRNVPALRRSLVILWLGIASGLPYLLIFGTLSIWLREAGVERSTIGFLSWAALSYGFKFIWAPLVDSLRLPFLAQRLGQRRSWLIVAQCCVILSLVWMSLWDPSSGRLGLVCLAIGAVMLGFSAATQDIVIDAYRIDFAPAVEQPLLAGTAVAGYRVGMLFAGAGALELTSIFGVEGSYSFLSWSLAYLCMAALMGTSILCTLVIKEPEVDRSHIRRSGTAASNFGLLLHFLILVVVFIVGFMLLGQLSTPWSSVDLLASRLGSFVFEVLRFSGAISIVLLVAPLVNRLHLVPSEQVRVIYIEPFADFFHRFGKLAIWLLCLICIYRVADIVMGVMAQVFYTDMGYSRELIGRISFGFGLIVTILGGILGGVLALRWGVMPMFLLGAILAAGSNLVFVYVAYLDEPLVSALVAAIVVDNLSGGLAGAMAVAFLSSLINREFSATQYAAFTSLTVLLPKLLAGYSGVIVDAGGYPLFFILTASLGIPVVLLILYIWKPYKRLLGS